MEYLSPKRKWPGFWERVRRQHGVISHEQLIELRFEPQAIKRRVAGERLHRLHEGVYAVGRPAVDQDGIWMAAVLACGEGAVLSHFSAAALLGIAPVPAVIDVSSPKDHDIPGIRTHRRRNLTDIGTCRGIPVTSPTLTLIDLATQLSDIALERAVDEADANDVITVPTLRHALDNSTRRPGLKRLRTLIDARTFTLTDSVLERLFLPLAQQAGRTPAQQTRDIRRDQAHLANGLTPVRFTHHQVKYDPKHVVQTLKAVAANL